MRKLTIISAIALCVATSAQAGGMSDPIMEMDSGDIAATTTGSSSPDMIIPLIFVAFVALAKS
ncbi:hypothetical protein [Octadecabacter sp. R77987]|uniref:hypothetical protein n=1 Tax=Octadecabacter sp. R77987 TaxID=3093874 RepID=UPI0036721785